MKSLQDSLRDLDAEYAKKRNELFIVAAINSNLPNGVKPPRYVTVCDLYGSSAELTYGDTFRSYDNGYTVADALAILTAFDIVPVMVAGINGTNAVCPADYRETRYIMSKARNALELGATRYGVYFRCDRFGAHLCAYVNLAGQRVRVSVALKEPGRFVRYIGTASGGVRDDYQHYTVRVAAKSAQEQRYRGDAQGRDHVYLFWDSEEQLRRAAAEVNA